MSEIDRNLPPHELFQTWMEEARRHPHIKEPTAMALATSDGKGDLHTRIVLCKEWSREGFVFFTNYDSRKGHDLADHPVAAAVFYWDPLFRQVKVSGHVQKTSRSESQAYWDSRPRESQLSQWISKQSQPVASRADLEKAWSEADRQFANQKIPCPDHWGGYLLIPQSIEFWIGQPGRLHDRFEFRKSGTAWTSQRLYP